MRYPNTRYGNPEELRYYAQGLSIKELARQLKRSEKSVRQWLSLEKKVPFWVPELLRLRHMEADLRMRQMGFGEQRLKLGIVRGTVIDFKLAGNAATKAPAPHRPCLPHNCNNDSQNASVANQDAPTCLIHARKHGTSAL